MEVSKRFIHRRLKVWGCVLSDITDLYHGHVFLYICKIYTPTSECTWDLYCNLIGHNVTTMVQYTKHIHKYSSLYCNNITTLYFTWYGLKHDTSIGWPFPNSFLRSWVWIVMPSISSRMLIPQVWLSYTWNDSTLECTCTYKLLGWCSTSGRGEPLFRNMNHSHSYTLYRNFVH